MLFILNTVCLCMIFALVTINIFLSSQVLGETDLTCEVSTSVGACIFAHLFMIDCGVCFSLLSACVIGWVCGALTMIVAEKISIAPVLSSIIMIMGVQSILNRVVPVTQMINVHDIFAMDIYGRHLLIFILCSIIIFGIYLLLHSERGLIIRMSGGSPVFAEKYGVNTIKMKTMIFALGNALCAIAGACIVMLQGSVNASIGTGTFVFGLAAILIGNKMYSSRDISVQLYGSIIGAIIYKCILEFITCFKMFNIDAAYNNLVASLVLIVFLAVLKSDSLVKVHGR